jgi:hypothetical protein
VNKSRIVAALLVGWTAFAYRIHEPYFHNDHFEHLSMARQMQFGELPVRDFFDPGRPLTLYLSALGQTALGGHLLSEAILTVGALAIGTALTFWLASAAARLAIIGLLSAVLLIAIAPRLYSYPKVIVFAVGLWVLWRYVDSPTRVRLIAVATATAFAFLMRHDFGVYAGIVAAVVIVAVHRGTAWRRLPVFLLAAALLVSPYLWWLAQHGRLVGSAASGVGSLLDAATVSWPSLRMGFSPTVVSDTRMPSPIKVRWHPDLNDGDRAKLEHQYGLSNGRSDDRTTFSYDLVDNSPAIVRALVNDPHVMDTHGINRGASSVDVPWWDRWGEKVGVGRIAWGPFTREGAEAWLYYLFWVIPAAAVLRLSVKALSPDRDQRSQLTNEALKVSSAVLLGLLLNLYLIRGSIDSRLPDVVVPPAVVGAWLLREHVDWIRRTTSTVRRVAQAVSLIVAMTLTWIAISVYENTASIGQMATAGISANTIRSSIRTLAQRPIDLWAPSDSTGVRGLTRYVHDCTTPADRVLLVAYEPQVFYYSERLFAGGMAYFHQRRFSGEAEQAEIVRKLQRQRVPLVIVDQQRLNLLEDDYAEVFRHVQTEDVHLGDATFGDERRGWRIYGHRQQQITNTVNGLPCYR